MNSSKSTQRFGLCGHPIAHSLSPKLFGAAYPQSGFSYELIQATRPEEAMRLFVEGGFGGMNVTAPFKSSILPWANRHTQECTAIGACNLIVREGNTFVAHNTDYLGVANALGQTALPLKETLCLLLGAGGAAKAAAYALLKGGATLLWANRTLAHIPASFCDQPTCALSLAQIDSYLPQCTLIVNTLPLSIPQTRSLTFSPNQTVFDASYFARPFQKQATEAGAPYIAGEQWLLHQAAPAFEAMTRLRPNWDAMLSSLMSL